MIVTINQLRRLSEDENNNLMPIGRGHVASQTRTSAGAFTACGEGAKLVRVATDTAITIDGYGAASSAYMPANSVEYFPAVEGRVFTIAAA